MEGIGISYGGSGYFRSLILAWCPGKRNLRGLLLSVLTTSAQSSLGTPNEFSGRVTAIIQLTGDEAEETLRKF
jgi:hypothetical protein